MSIREFIEAILQLDFDSGDFSNNKFTKKLDSSDEFAELLAVWSNNRELELLEDAIDSTECTNRYTDGNFEVTLKGNFEDNQYSISVEER